MIAARKSILFGLAALALLSGLSGCIVAERPHGRADYVAEGPSWHPHHRHNSWNNGWQGNNQGGDWNRYN